MYPFIFDLTQSSTKKHRAHKVFYYSSLKKVKDGLIRFSTIIEYETPF